VRTPVPPPRVNTAQKGSLGSPLVKNDPKLTLQPKISPQVPVRGLNKLTYMRAHPTLNATININDNNNNNNINEENSIKPTTSTPTGLVNNNNNINGVDNVTPGEKNSGENSPR
jgi:hypothetical protein